MSKMKIIKIDPLELSPHLTWAISGLLQISLKDFVVFVDDKNNTMYVDKTRKIPKKDIDGFLSIATHPETCLTDKQLDFLDYVYKEYGFAACKALERSYSDKRESMLKQKAEQLSKTIAPEINKELNRATPDEMLVYYIIQQGRKLDKKTYYNMVGYGDIYNFMLGYLVGTGKISTAGVIDIDEEESEE